MTDRRSPDLRTEVDRLRTELRQIKTTQLRLDVVQNAADIATNVTNIATNVTDIAAIQHFSERVYYTADATWTKADYPGLRAIMIRLVAGGGGGGGCTGTTSSTQCAAGGGGGGGGYAETFVLEAALGATEEVQVGVGGAGASAGQNAGSIGENSFFGTGTILCEADHGDGGSAGNLIASPDYGNAGGAGGFPIGGNNDLDIDGGDGWTIVAMQAAVVRAPGGSTVWAPTRVLGRSASGFNGATGHGAGGGGSGGCNANDQSTARSGGTGADGLVIVDIFL